MAHSRFLPLVVIERYIPLMEHQAVSEVARSRGGFLPAYRKAKGDPDRLSSEWKNKREGFIARHMAQVKAGGEVLFESKNVPTRRHLALIAWAYSPSPRRL